MTFAQEAEMTSEESTSSSVELKSKKGVNILPEEGDYAISINAMPLINLISRTSLDNTNNQPFGFADNTTQEIRVKRFLDANTAIRAGINLTVSSMTYKTTFTDPSAPAPLNNSQQTLAEDMLKRGNSYLTLAGGLEKRRGAGRLQGVYGAMASLTFGGSTGYKDTYTYGVGLEGTTGNDNAGDGTFETDWNGEGVISYDNLDATDDYRILERKMSGGMGIGLLGFVGVEYFFAPKISVGGEFHLGLSLGFNGGKITEKRQYSSTETHDYESVGVSNSSMTFGPSNNSGSVFFNFHF